MATDKESQDVKGMQGLLTVDVFSRTPVVGCRMTPIVRLEVDGHALPPPHALRFTWYRERFKCSVHRSKVASVQCIACVQLKIPGQESYHCSRDCFVAAWEEHLARHRIARETINNATSSNHREQRILRMCGSRSDLESATGAGEDWVKVSTLENFEPSMDDVGIRLRLESIAVDRSTGTPMSPMNFVETNPVINFPPPLTRYMIQVEKCRTFWPTDEVTFSVLSYNILADVYARSNSEMRAYCPKWALEWDYRRKNLLREIIGYNADIICLQEVQSDHFENFFLPELSKRGYSVMYKGKKAGLYTDSGGTFEGCAICFRNCLFKEIKRYVCEFANTASSMVEALGPERKNEGCIRLKKDNVALVVVLEAIKTARSYDPFPTRICVATTHIIAKRDLPDVKLCQVSDLVQGLERIVQSQIPLLICADLNSLPHSDPHKLLVRGGIDSLQSTEENDPLGIYKYLKLHHSLNLASAYSSLSRATGIEEKQLEKMDPKTSEPLFTNFTPNFSGTIDYILYSVNHLKVTGVLELLDRENEHVRHGLPSPRWSSDHIAVMARFRVLTPYSSWR